MRFKPYDIDIKYEQRTYKYVGKDYGSSRNAYLGLINQVMRFYRKMRNRKQNKYAICHTYTEWENHVKMVVKKDIINGKDLIHWLYRKRNVEKQILEAVKMIVIPLYLAVLTTSHFYNIESRPIDISSSVGGLFIVIVMVFGICFDFLHDACEKVNFYNDFIRIAEAELMDGRVKENDECNA
ncbi:MAG: hypothetical protein J1E98_12140 [Lachnospiraceae bacterium]|nr:hypothetical protein [Lachnospiraceae bacterium]